MEKTKNALIWKNLYIILLIVASIPLSCAYVMEGGDILVWLMKIEVMKNDFSLANQNIWLILPTILRLIGLNITVTYRIYMLFLNIVTLFSIKKMMEEIFDNKIVVFSGVLLFMLSPYRVYILFDKADLGAVAAWAVIPLLLWGIIRLAKGDKRLATILVTAISFASIGYADYRIWVFMLLVTIVSILWYRKFLMIFSIIFGSVLFLPELIFLIRSINQNKDFLLMEGMTSKGYLIGQFFTTWVYRTDYPGFGIGVLLSIVCLICLSFERKNLKIYKKYGYFVTVTMIFILLSMTSFLGNFVQASNFLGIASFSISVIAAYGMKCILDEEHILIRIGVPLFIMLATTAVYVYMCNTLTYYRIPMYLIDTL